MSLTDEDKRWFLEQLQRIEQKLGQFEQKLAQLERDFEQKVERVETRLLTEFHKWASPAETRARSHTAAIRALDIELETLSERMDKLEGGPSSTS
jgi:hypothetical protein